jgi:hypothetical protein
MNQLSRIFLLLIATLHLPATARPNIITIFVDDMGYSDLSCFGGDLVRTDNLDRLATEPSPPAKTHTAGASLHFSTTARTT